MARKTDQEILALGVTPERLKWLKEHEADFGHLVVRSFEEQDPDFKIYLLKEFGTKEGAQKNLNCAIGYQNGVVAFCTAHTQGLHSGQDELAELYTHYRKEEPEDVPEETN